MLRLSGLIEGINFIKQKQLETTGSKPDFTFLLPQNLKLNMDVKFPFNNYQLYAEAKMEKEREEYRKKFLTDVRNRIKEVQTREYINPEENTVDYVILFDQLTPEHLIAHLRPQILIKGADWTARQIIGREIVRRSGGRVVRLPLVKGYSSTQLIKRIQVRA